MHSPSEDPWISKTPERLPDFIIGGAMKSGTTTLHAILERHPDIAMAQDELGFFDMDSLLQHSDFNFFDKHKKEWTVQSMATHSELLWEWYASQLGNLKGTGQLIGEDSTTYLASRHAARRIALQDKPIKMLFVLRHPTHRTISNYLHALKSGRALHSLEDTLRYDPNSILRRSLYKEQLEYYYHYLPSNRIKVILFEDLIQDRANCIKEVCDFLGIDFNLFKPSDFDVHSNKTLIPKYIWLQLMRNRWMRGSRDYRYSGFLPVQPEFQKKTPLKYRVIDSLHKRLNPKRYRTFVPNPATILLLDDFFKTELEGIDTIAIKTLYTTWFPN